LAVEDRPTIAVWLKRPESRTELLKPWITEQLGEAPVGGVVTTVETETKYEGYIQQQERQIGRLRGSENRRIPSDFSYQGVPGLSREAQEGLQRVLPTTLGQAGRIPGVTPAAIAVLDVYLSIASA
jgi:tRNA uridine 5-carboxymethylaminomethyl modification enzyme